jgi:predicted metal-dependent peptidase
MTAVVQATKRSPVETKLKQAKIKLLFGQPFFGTLIMHLPLVDVTDQGWCPTAAVDGRYIYYNREFLKKLDVDEIQFVLCHEVLHVAFDHLGRRSHRDPKWWNMANDYVINGSLIRDKIGKMPTERVPVDETDSTGKKTTSQRVGLYDEKYVGWTSEAVYDDLEKRKVKKELTLDVHLELGNDGKPGQDGKNGPTIRDANGNEIKLSEAELKELREAMKGKILQAANAAAGRMPASLQRLIDELVEPKVNWRDLLKQSIQSCIVDDFTWMRPNRKHMYSGVFLPTLDKDETIDLQVAIDMSGSISDEMARDFISEVYGIMDMYHDFKIGIVCFDTKTYNYKEFTKDTQDELLKYECKGGGGTDFMAFWNFWQEENLEPKLAVVFTDGYPFGTWGPENYAETLWVITEGYKTKVKPPFGRYAYYEHGKGVEEVGSA